MFFKVGKRFSDWGLALAVTSVGVLGLLILYWQLSNDRAVTTQDQLNISQQKNRKYNLPDKDIISQSSDRSNKQQPSAIVKQSIKPTDQSLSKVIGQWEQTAKTEIFNVLIPAKFQGQVLKQVKLGSKEKAIALTFDDGPWPRSTLKILEILKKDNIKATFFMVGIPLKEYPQIAQQVVLDGHAVANHTWSHRYRRMSPADAAREIEDTEALIYKVTGLKPAIFRPPGGVMNNGVVDYAKKHKYFVAMWSSDSNDYSRPSVPRLVRNVMKDAKPGGMVLMHDGGGDRAHTIKALPIIISQLKKRGYKFVTVPELLDLQEQEQQVLAKKSTDTPTPNSSTSLNTNK
ncbi:polysaccharide deacetylase [Crinalium epipsammum PCC 9333]|uniref:Polysaccharide deacetylase n=1 Tax=Crinalium epipsammum PCC 9333 TaxID=1173022 RepID=K9W0E1_9CYAN|nr:polysaccharide deacetylase family protein [Crinalium epipsammum]AFZ13853.1 polysaccharide deacetylase [Crinalium epipsammum PCC 9333]